MSDTITGTIGSGVTLIVASTTIAATALLTTDYGVGVALYGTLNTSSPVSVTNFGTIIGSNFEAVVFQNSYGDAAVAGTIDNESGALIDGSGGFGLLSYGPAVIDNDGTITGTTYAIGVQGDPTTIVNGGFVQGGDTGILEIGASATADLSVTNVAGGTIAGTSYGIYLEAGGDESVSNQAGGTITGGVALDAGGIVLNAGVIEGASNGPAVRFLTNTAPVRLIVDPGAVFIGNISAASGNSNTVELAVGTGGTGTLGNFGSTITNFNTLVFDSGANWAISGDQAGLDTPTITGFALGDTIDLTDFAATGDSFANGTLTLSDPSATTTMNIQGSFVSGNFLVTPDVNNGSLIELAPLALTNPQAGQTVLDNGTLQPFSGVSVLDLNSGPQAETITITMSNAGSVTGADGTLSGTGLTATSPGIYTLTAINPAAATTELDALVFTPTDHQVAPGGTVTTAFAVSVTDTANSTAATTTTVVATALCFLAGTLIETPSGETEVERLVAGDLVLTASGAARPVVWIGHRWIDLARHVDPVRVRPIRIAAGAFPDGTPHRDLLVSPDHAVVFDGMLIPAKQLVNGASIASDLVCREVTYFHLELDCHDILIAEGLAAESYLDTGNRGTFANGDQPIVLHPDFGTGQQARVNRSCLPFADRPDQVEPVWRALAERAEALGWVLPRPVLTNDPDLHLLVGTRRIDPIAIRGRLYTFLVPPGGAPIKLSSRSAYPREAWPWIADDRRLGTMVRGLVHRSRDDIRVVAIDDPALKQGWWAVEWDDGRPGRWTDADAVLPNLGSGVLEVELSGTMRYPAERAAFAGESAADVVAA